MGIGARELDRDRKLNKRRREREKKKMKVDVREKQKCGSNPLVINGDERKNKERESDWEKECLR